MIRIKEGEERVQIGNTFPMCRRLKTKIFLLPRARKGASGWAVSGCRPQLPKPIWVSSELSRVESSVTIATSVSMSTVKISQA